MGFVEMYVNYQALEWSCNRTIAPASLTAHEITRHMRMQNCNGWWRWIVILINEQKRPAIWKSDIPVERLRKCWRRWRNNNGPSWFDAMLSCFATVCGRAFSTKTKSCGKQPSSARYQIHRATSKWSPRIVISRWWSIEKLLVLLLPTLS
jgi:hypothetical protein